MSDEGRFLWRPQTRYWLFASPLQSLAQLRRVRTFRGALRHLEGRREEDRKILRALRGQNPLEHLARRGNRLVLFCSSTSQRHRLLELTVELRFDNDDQPVVLGRLRDITSRQIDPLTRLPRAPHFSNEIEAWMGEPAKVFGLIVADGNHFKLINDTYGHDAGNFVLEHVGLLLGRLTSREIKPVRLHGDEFAVLVHADTDGGFWEIVGQLREALSFPLVLPGGQKITVSFAVGAYVPRRAGETGLDVFRKADKAMFRAKQGLARA